MVILQIALYNKSVNNIVLAWLLAMSMPFILSGCNRESSGSPIKKITQYLVFKLSNIHIIKI